MQPLIVVEGEVLTQADFHICLQTAGKETTLRGHHGLVWSYPFFRSVRKSPDGAIGGTLVINGSDRL